MQALREAGKGKASSGSNDGLSPEFDHFEPGCNDSQSRDLPSDKNLTPRAKVWCGSPGSVPHQLRDILTITLGRIIMICLKTV